MTAQASRPTQRIRGALPPRLAALGWMLLGPACSSPGAPGMSGMSGTLSPEALRAAGEYSADRRGAALLVTQHGQVVFEDYPHGGQAATSRQIYSGTKSFWAVATLAAAEDGLLTLDEPVAATIPEWRSPPGRQHITIRDLLQFTSGLAPDFRLHSDAVADRNAKALETPVVATRGAAFTYGPSHGQVLGEVLRRKLRPRRETPVGYLQRTVLDPLGLRGVEHRLDRAGNPLVATGMKLTARQWARFGTLLLERGRYRDRVVVPEARFAELTKGSRANPAFGLGLWLNHQATRRNARAPDIEDMLELPWQQQDWRDACLCPDAPPDLVAAVGSGYQRLFVIPSRGIVIVRQGKNAPFSDAEFLRLILAPPPAAH